MAKNPHERNIEDYERAALGELDIHMWSGEINGRPCRYMYSKKVPAGTEVEADDLPFDEEYIQRHALRHEGPLSKEEILMRLGDFRSFLD